ncbi:hypothetical protein ACLOJK_038599 [Asimina triloba]
MQARKSTQNVLGLLHVTVHQKGGSIVYLPIDASNAEDVPDTRRLGPQTSIVASSNGLLLCSHRPRNSLKYCVYNPTTIALGVLPSDLATNSHTLLGLAAGPTAFLLGYYMVVGIELRAKAHNANVYGSRCCQPRSSSGDHRRRHCRAGRASSWPGPGPMFVYTGSGH